jgi:hypothetical protein
MMGHVFNASPEEPLNRRRRSHSRHLRWLGPPAIDIDAPVEVPNAATVGLSDQSTEDELVVIAGAHGVTVGPLPSAGL